MAYQDVIIGDSPFVYYRLNETSGTVAANLGSKTGSGTISASITKMQPPAGSIDGYSIKIPNATTGNISTASYSFGSAFTYEAWYKREMGFTGSTVLWEMGAGLMQITVSNTGYFRVLNGSGLNDGYTDATIADGQWHHLAITYSSGTWTYYKDGVSLGTKSGTPAARTDTVYIGNRGNSGLTAWLDEVAMWQSNIGAAKIAAHYAAGFTTPSVTVQASPAVINLSTPAPVVTAANVYNQVLTPTADRAVGVYRDNFPNESAILIGTPADANTSAGILMKFNYVVPSGQVTLDTATLTLTNTSSIATGVRINRVTSDWQELTAGAFTATATSHIATLAANASTTINVSELVNAWISGSPNQGLYISATTAGDGSVATREHPTVANRPKLTVVSHPPAAIPVNVIVPPMSLSVTAPNVTNKAAINRRITVPAATLSANTAAPVVTTTKNARVTVPAVAINVTMPGGTSRNPDFRAYATPIEAWIFSPNAKGFGGTDAKSTVTGTMVANLSTRAPVVNLKTDRRNFVNTAMAVKVSMVGIYKEEDDKYLSFIPTTADADDRWYQMNETGGAIAYDMLTGIDSANGAVIEKVNAIYVNSPSLNVEGPYLRKAVQFDGINDHMVMPGYGFSAFSDSDLTIEFSIKTAQKNGVLIGGGGSYGGRDGQSPTIPGNGESIRLVDGNITISGYTVRKNIADGQWHHIVISVPTGSQVWSDFDASKIKPHFVSIDGKTEWARRSAALSGGAMLPYSVMARKDSNGVFEHVNGMMRDLVIRLNWAVSENTASKLYYLWSNSLLINPEPMAVNLTMKNPITAKGNTKRMIVLYGLPHYMHNNQANRTRDGLGTYYSIFAGFFIPTNIGAVTGATGEYVSFYRGGLTYSNTIRMSYFNVKPFTLEGYICYPVAIATTPGSDGAKSAPGLENGIDRDPYTGQLIDDKTGLNRFFNLQNDLREDVTDFDAITAINYPAVQAEENNVTSDEAREFRQHNLGLNSRDWTLARDRLRDSILQACYQGVNLWITEPPMAEHLGFIMGWVKHETGARVEFFGPANVDATGYTNKRAEQLDAEHLTSSAAQGGVGIGQFNYTWQANAKRQIVATEPGLTDHPSYEIVERILYESDNAWTPHSRIVAYDVANKTGGLTIGDKLVMNMWEQNDYTGNYPEGGWSVGVPRKWIVSAKPDGIAGKVISKEMDFYYGPNGVVRQNPWKNNVYTIVAERGTVVRGSAIAGRAFIEFMDPETQRIKVTEDRNKSQWNGEANRFVSTWSLDSRRYKEIIVSSIINRVLNRAGGSVSFEDVVRYSDIQDPDLIYRPFMSMNARGLNWLADSDNLDPGEAKTYAPSMQISLSTNDVKLVKTRNLATSVTGAMRIDLELRQPKNFRGNDASEKVLPMVLNIELKGTGKTIKVPAMQLDLVSPNATAIGDGDAVYVYMDAEREVTLYLMEE